MNSNRTETPVKCSFVIISCILLFTVLAAGLSVGCCPGNPKTENVEQASAPVQPRYEVVVMYNVPGSNPAKHTYTTDTIAIIGGAVQFEYQGKTIYASNFIVYEK
jgi:hypothetical protein